MIRKITSTGLALVAVLALGAVTAAGAMAAEFHAEATSTTLTGAQTTKFEFTLGAGFSTIRCGTATFSGTTSSTSTTFTEQKITPSFSGCFDSLGRSVDWVFGACYYNLQNTGSADLVCPSGDVKTELTNSLKQAVCDITIQAQTGINGLSYSNGTGANGKADITVGWHTSNLSVTATNTDGFSCGVNNGPYTASLSGTITLEGSTGISFS